MPTLDLADRSLNYVDTGTGPAVLLLHAFPLHSGMWQQQVAGLKSRFRLIAPDARGMGRSTPVPSALSMEMIADDAVAILDHLQLERIAVVGLSMGGYAAFALWRRHRARVAALALCDTRASADTEEGRAGRESFATEVVSRGADWAAMKLLPVLLRQPAAATVEAAVRSMIGSCAPQAIAAAQRGMAARSDATTELQSIDVPTAVVCGAEDGLTPPLVSRDLSQRIAGARYVEIPQAGHLSNLEAPEAFNSALGTFLDDVFPTSTQ